MSVRKYAVPPECQQYSKQHIMVNASQCALTKRDYTELKKHCTERLLTLNHVNAESLDFLDDWKDLHDLRMYGCKIPDCTALTRLKNFKNLWYHTNRSKTPDLSFLSSLKTLEQLGVGYVTHLTSFPDLSGCKRLKRLDIFSCKKLEDISKVQRIPKLQSFSIVDTPQLPPDLELIMAMKSLKKMSGAFGTAARNKHFHELLKKHGLQYGF